MLNSQWRTTAETGEAWGVSEKTVRMYIRQGRLRARKFSNRYLIRADAQKPPRLRYRWWLYGDMKAGNSEDE